MAAEPQPSATVVLLRAAPAPGAQQDFELLLLQRSSRDGRPGPWVFPGGRVEAADIASAGGAPGASAALSHARAAAVRETREEAGLELDAATLAPISRWITPEIAPRRFDTWFFLGRVGGAGAASEVAVDGREICAHRWLMPRAALDGQRNSELHLAPPTFVTLCWLAEFSRVADALRELPAREFITFRPRVFRSGAGAIMLYPGDAGYESGDPAADGPRHRLRSDGSQRYAYERGPYS
ncbi:MAG: NUDIX hydrolase [Deltaproteobacteria bacterium]|nr:NUDIX hydrolase [Deltaproteobacteria bacterium]